MAATLDRAFGYQGDSTKLPVPDLAAALPFYESMLGFHVVSRRDAPVKAAVLARDGVEIGLEENGGDPTQDGCAFHVTDLAALLEELRGRGLAKGPSDVGVEEHDGKAFDVFYVVAPDGLCYWFGERRAQ